MGTECVFVHSLRYPLESSVIFILLQAKLGVEENLFRIIFFKKFNLLMESETLSPAVFLKILFYVCAHTHPTKNLKILD